MNVLRQRLKDENPELCFALENSWRIAENEWLPALAPSNDSYNSYPHLRNLENHLNNIMFISGKNRQLFNPSAKPILNTTEVYIMLSAILFHDIGRVDEKNGYHGTKSAELIKEQSGFLGIYSGKLAESIAKICEYHNVEKKRKKKLKKEMATIIFDPFEKIRELELSALLILCDCMDDAFSRIIPNYVKEIKRTGAKSVFRRHINSVYFDPIAQMVCTEIGDVTSNVKNIRNNYEFKINKKLDIRLKQILKEIGIYDNITNTLIVSGINDDNLSKLISKVKSKKIKSCLENIDDQLLKLINQEYCLNPYEKLIISHFIFIEKKINPSIDWYRPIVIAMIMADVCINNEILQEIRDVLAIIGINVRSWLIEYQNHLFNPMGMETYEPVLHKEYLKNIAKSMWQLSTEVFGNCYFTYETLASAVREPDIELVRLSVKRLSIITKEKKIFNDIKTKIESPKVETAIWAGDTHWKWLIEKYQNESIQKKDENYEKDCYNVGDFKNENSAICKKEKGKIFGLKRLINTIQEMGEPL